MKKFLLAIVFVVASNGYAMENWEKQIRDKMDNWLDARLAETTKPSASQIERAVSANAVGHAGLQAVGEFSLCWRPSTAPPVSCVEVATIQANEIAVWFNRVIGN
jgi:hypothetical protein